MITCSSCGDDYSTVLAGLRLRRISQRTSKIKSTIGIATISSTGTAAAGTSIQRLDNTDDNDLLDWNTLVAPIVQAQAQTFGALNVGQTAF